MMTRNERKLLAEQTLQIVRQGWYDAGPAGRRVSLGESVARSVAGTQLVRPSDWPAVLRRAEDAAARAVSAGGPSVEVTGETTLAAARRLVASHGGVLALNFASAKNPGGGFLGGSQAQEESLARSSALYPTLLAAPDYYEANRRCETACYTDHMIYGPAVPVFRDDDGALLDAPYEVSFITAPAVNVSALRQHGRYDAARVERVMADRVAKVLALAADKGHDTLVFGAWGCGVFGNDPATVARLFSDALVQSVGLCFKQVTFAVFDRTPGQEVLAPFQRLFAQQH